MQVLWTTFYTDVLELTESSTLKVLLQMQPSYELHTVYCKIPHAAHFKYFVTSLITQGINHNI